MYYIEAVPRLKVTGLIQLGGRGDKFTGSWRTRPRNTFPVPKLCPLLSLQLHTLAAGALGVGRDRGRGDYWVSIKLSYLLRLPLALSALAGSVPWPCWGQSRLQTCWGVHMCFNEHRSHKWPNVTAEGRQALEHTKLAYGGPCSKASFTFCLPKHMLIMGEYPHLNDSAKYTLSATGIQS